VSLLTYTLKHNGNVHLEIFYWLYLFLFALLRLASASSLFDFESRYRTAYTFMLFEEPDVPLYYFATCLELIFYRGEEVLGTQIATMII